MFDNQTTDFGVPASSAHSMLPHTVENCQAFRVRSVALLVDRWIAA